MKYIRLFGAASGPDFNMDAGRPYLVPDHVAKKLLAAKMVTGTTVKKEKDGREAIETIYGGPAAEVVTDPRLVATAVRLPSQPDPDDRVVMDDEGYLEDVES